MLEYEKYMNTNLKKGMLGEEKRTNYITAMKQTLNDLNIDLIFMYIHHIQKLS